MYAKACVFLLAICIALISNQNAQYFARGHFLHLLPMLFVVGAGWAVLRDSGPPKAATVFWTLAATATASVTLELAFEIYKHKPFDEQGLLTLLSFSQLLLTSFTAFSIWRQRKKPGRFRLRDGSTIWLIIAIGFVYLAADEEILLHEGAGHSFHNLLGLAETAWTSRLDDALVGLYGLVGIAALWFYRSEIFCFPLCFRLLQVGFAALFLSVVADALSHRPDFFVWLLGQERGMLAYALGEALDEISKVVSEIFFLTGFSSGLRDAQEAARPLGASAQG